MREIGSFRLTNHRSGNRVHVQLPPYRHATQPPVSGAVCGNGASPAPASCTGRAPDIDASNASVHVPWPVGVLGPEHYWRNCERSNAAAG